MIEGGSHIWNTFILRVLSQIITNNMIEIIFSFVRYHEKKNENDKTFLKEKSLLE
jgi:hypothetical protein